MNQLAVYANGDARIALNIFELAVSLASRKKPDAIPTLTTDDLESALQRKILQYDKAGEEHYNLISALHKSLRNSDPDASLYWLGRMLEAGEDPVYIARRMVRFASEDVGLADVRALSVALECHRSRAPCRLAGMQAGPCAGGRISFGCAKIQCAYTPPIPQLFPMFSAPSMNRRLCTFATLRPT